MTIADILHTLILQSHVVMSKSKSYQSWIDAGYDLFSKEGFEGIQIERLARILDLNKSGFYHYFCDRNIFFEHLMQQHHEQVDQIITETKSIQAYDPEFLHLLIRFKATIMAICNSFEIVTSLYLSKH